MTTDIPMSPTGQSTLQTRRQTRSANPEIIKQLILELEEQKKSWETQAAKHNVTHMRLTVIILILIMLSFLFGLFDFGQLAAAWSFVAGLVILLYRSESPFDKANFERQSAIAAHNFIRQLKLDEKVTSEEYDNIRFGFDALCRASADSYPQGAGFEAILALYSQVNKSYGGYGQYQPSDWWSSSQDSQVTDQDSAQNQ